ncbi:MAG TPA: transglutaminase-like domain-containing protein [Ilumatobacteraceae bacterium]|nr:transglutaminase-like domain-containing protein [Ilumatobacteraceae bacterium]
MELGRVPALLNGRRLVRALAVLIFATGLALSGARAVGTRFEPVLLIPGLLAVLVGWSMARLHILVRALGQAVVFVGSGLWVAYASDGTAADLGRGLLDGPHQLVTTAWPCPRFPTIFVALAAFIYLAAAVAVDLAMRLRWRALAIAPLVVAMIAIVSVGAPDGAQWQAVLFAAVAAFTLLWIGLDDRVASIRSGVFVAVTTGLAALLTLVTVSVAVAQRANPRHGESANRELALLDPLAAVEAQQTATPARPLYEVQSSSLGQMHYWRLAALDTYNGESWSTNGQVAPVGNRLDDGTAAPDATVTVTALSIDTLLWVSPGRLLRSSAPVETDSDRRVVRIIGTDRPAVTTFTVEPEAAFVADSAGTLARIEPTDIESSFSSLASTIAGSDGTIAERIAKLASTLHDTYQLNSNLPGGVQQSLVDGFLRNHAKIGNLEQFVTGFVLLARSMGVDARIATGYVIDSTAPSASISTADAVAWAEVLTDKGWLSVDVVPESSTPDLPKPTPAGQPETPAAQQPLLPPQVDPADPNKPVEAPPVPATAGRWSQVRIWALRGGLFTGLLLWPFVVFSAIVTWKKLRRRKGLKAPDPARRVSTAWTLATDALVDAGAMLNPSQTNAQLVAAGVAAQPAAGPPLGRLQRHADAVTFASATCDPQRATDAVDQLRLVESSIRNSSTRWWRWKWWLSTRSLRRSTQSPLR